MKNKSANLRKILCLFILGIVFGIAFKASAVDYAGSSFIVRDPVLSEGGGYSTSTTFGLFQGIGGSLFGESTSTSYKGWAGFLYYPLVVSTPAITATAGNAQVALSWTAASTDLGWRVGSYAVGKSTASGGPYTFTNVSTDLSSTQSSLTNGTTYYFVVRVLDGLGETIATSSQVSAAPVAACGNGVCSGGETCSTCSADCGSCPSSGGGGGGGGGGWSPAPVVETAANFSGRAYPKSTVTLLKDAQIAATTVAGSDAGFSVKISGLSAGNYIFSVYSEDAKGRRSSLLTFPVGITSGATSNVGGIFLAPTISTDKEEVKRGDNVMILGQSAPQADIVIVVNSDEEYFAKTISDKSGLYAYNFDTSPLELGEHYTKSKALIGNMLASGYSSAVNFKVGAKTIEREKEVQIVKNEKTDLNNDQKVNLIDFSIMSYWYKRPLTEKAKSTVDLNGDKKVDLKDFSIMAYYWTG